MNKKLNTIIGFLMLIGMLSFVIYISYAMLGNYLWAEYNPITTDISSLSAVGAPNQNILNPFIMIYGICFLTFTFTYTFWVFYDKKNRNFKIGAILLLLMSIISAFGYNLFPLVGDKTQMTFQNLMHILVTVAVVFLSIAALYFTAVGNLKNKERKKFGMVLIILATIFTVLGATNPIGMAMNLNILGLTERLAIYSLHFIIGIIGIYESVVIFKKSKQLV